VTGARLIERQRVERARQVTGADYGSARNLLLAADGRARKIRANTRERIQLITWGLEAGDWRTLGYDSPAAWYAELTDYNKLIPPDVRRRLVAALRNQGYSLRGIASELDVSKDTVARDLAGVSRDEVSHGETPDRVTGTDGKTYPASRPVSEPERWAKIAEPEPEPVGITIETGRVAKPVEPDTESVKTVVRHLPHCPTCTCYDDDN
jgi:transposase-like protein